MTTNQDLNRKAFETALKARKDWSNFEIDFSFDDAAGDYTDDSVNIAWYGWQLALSAQPAPMFEAACSGLRYTKPNACGEVAAIHIDGVRYAIAPPTSHAAYTEFMIERLNTALDHIRSGNPHMASACLLADVSRLKADLQESSPPPQSGFAADLASRQRQLDPEVAKIIYDNMESLYEKSQPAQSGDVADEERFESALHDAIEMLEEHSSAHKDKRAAEYNECDTTPCMWCEKVDSAIPILRSFKRAAKGGGAPLLTYDQADDLIQYYSQEAERCAAFGKRHNAAHFKNEIEKLKPFLATTKQP